MKYIMTTRGKIEDSELGFTYEHEHLYTYLAQKDGAFDYEVTNLDNMEKDLKDIKACGCKSIVDASAIGMGRNAEFLNALSIRTGMNVICTTGFYRDEYIPDVIKDMSDNKVYDLIMNEINNGIGYTGIRPGMIKIGVSKDIVTDEEFRLGKIMCAVQRETNLPFYVHFTDGTCAVETAKYLIDSGAVKEKLILGHVDVPKDRYYLEKLCSFGVNVSMDKFGRDYNNHDKNKVDIVKYLIGKGYLNRILVGGDMGNTKYLSSYSGKPGLDYIIKELIPYMINMGINKEDIKQIFEGNPSRIFSV